MKVAVIGATGVLGRHVVTRLVERGHRVHALGTDPDRLSPLRSEAVTVFRASILEPDSLLPALGQCDAALHLATAIPRPGTQADWLRNDEIRRAGTRNLLQACKAAGVVRYVQQSIAHLVNSDGGQWLVESDDPRPSVVTQSALDMEHQVEDSGLDWRIARGGMFYGPGTLREQFWAGEAQAGRLVIPGDGSAYLSLIEISDMAAAVVLATETPLHGLTVNIVDDEPVTYAALFRHLALTVGAQPPPLGGPLVWGSVRASNKRAKELLAWSPHFPSYRSGLANLLGHRPPIETSKTAKSLI